MSLLNGVDLDKGQCLNAPLVISELSKGRELCSVHKKEGGTTKKLTRKTPRLANMEIAYNSGCPTNLLLLGGSDMMHRLDKTGRGRCSRER